MKEMSIVVAGRFLGFCASRFLNSVCPDYWKHPTNADLLWLKPPYGSRGGKLSLDFGTYTTNDKSHNLHLFYFPEALVGRDFYANDLKYPVELSGLILVYCLDDKLFWENLTELRENRWGGPGWAEKHQLPYVIATIDRGNSMVTMEEFREALNVPDDVPVLHCSDKNLDSVFRNFPRDFGNDVLERLVAEIEKHQ